MNEWRTRPMVKLDAERLPALQDEGVAIGVKELRRAVAPSVEDQVRIGGRAASRAR